MRAVFYCHAWAGHGRNAGGETTAQDMMKALNAAGWETEVRLSQAVSGLEPYDLDGVRVFPYETKSDITRAARGVDLLLTHLECSMRATYLGQREHIPVCQVIHNTMWQTEGYIALGPDILAYNTEWVRDHHEAVPPTDLAVVAQRGGVLLRPAQRRPHEVCVVHPAIDPARYRRDRRDSPFHAAGKNSRARSRSAGSTTHPGASRRPAVLLVNLWADKGPRVFYHLARKFPEVRFVGVLGGYGHQEIEELPNVDILPNTPNIADVYEQVDVVLMPSTYESFGRVAIEAAASGVPCIAAPTPGLKEALGEGGIFAPLDDLGQWEDALAMTLDPRRYRPASEYALSRSAHWAALRAPELAEFVETCGRVAARFKAVYRR